MTYLTRRSLLAGLGACALPPSFARAATFAGDARLLREIYTALHPGLLRYNSRGSATALFDWLDTGLDAATDRGTAFLALSRLTAAIRCGHTYANPFNQRRSVQSELFGTQTRLPFLFTWLNGRMIVIQDFSEARMPAGTRIERLGQMPAPALLAAMMPLSRADGHNDAKRIRNLDVRGADRFEAFDIFLPLMFPRLTDGGRIPVEGHKPDGTRLWASLALVRAEDRNARATRPPAPQDAAPMWTLDLPPARPAWLTMSDWTTYNTHWDWRAWLNDALDRIVVARAPALVIDLRGNEGGEDCGDLILPRLIDRPFVTSTYQRLTRYRRIPDALNPYLDTWDDSFRDWGTDATGPDAAGFYRMTRFTDDPQGHRIIRPAGQRYHGRVFVIVDAANSSATFQFAQAVQLGRLGTLVGEPTGGNRRGINGSAFMFVRLPACGLEVDLPLVGLFPESPQPDAGLIPDRAIARTASDIAAGRDPIRAAIGARA